MNMVKYAERELDLIGMTKDDPYTEETRKMEATEGMNCQIREKILEVIKTFSKQGHSGFSANYCLAILEKLMSYHPLSPLMNKEVEWVETEEMGICQHRRAFALFRYGKDDFRIMGKKVSLPMSAEEYIARQQEAGSKNEKKNTL